MPVPKTPPRPSPKISTKMSPRLAEVQKLLNAFAASERMTMLVDYLSDLQHEFDWAAAELKELGFCAPCYLSELDDGDDHDCVEGGS
jgi:hypothetical protein